MDRRRARVRRGRRSIATMLALCVAPVTGGIGVTAAGAAPSAAASAGAPAAAAAKPNIFFYNLDDLRDAVPGSIDPLQFMPRTRRWMADGTRFATTYVSLPSCCPSRAALMTGRYSHNNGVRLQSQGPNFDSTHSMACYLKSAGYATYGAGKFLTTWPKTTRPPCFDHSTVIWGGYHDVQSRVDGVARQLAGYSTTALGVRGREYLQEGIASGKPFLLYETPQAPHWSDTTVNGTATRLAIPSAKYADATVGKCAGVPEPDRSDKPAYVRRTNFTTTSAQAMCESQMRAIMTADDEFAATMQFLADRGVLANTLVILSSDNGYNWGEHGRTEKFVPYEPSMRVPLLVRWPGRVAAGTNTARRVSYVDLLPTMLDAAGFTLPAGAPPLDGESLLRPSSRTVLYAEYFADVANGQKDGVPSIDTWKMVRRGNVKYIQTYNASGAVTFREYYDLASDPAEHTNLLADGKPANDPPQAELTELAALLNSMATCKGAACVK